MSENNDSTKGDIVCPNHTFARVYNGNPDAIMHFCKGIETSRHDGEVVDGVKKGLIERTKNYSIKKNPDGTTTHSLTLSFDGSVRNVIESQGEDEWGIKEAARLYKVGRRAWLDGDFNTVADLFGVLV